MKGGSLKIVFRSGYVVDMLCSSYEMVTKADGTIKRLVIEPVYDSQDSILYIDTSEIALVTIKR